MTISDGKMKYNINIVFGFVFIGVMLLWSGSASMVWGYGWLTFSLISLLFLVFARISQQAKSANEGNDLLSIIQKYLARTWPIIMLIILLYWYTKMNVAYGDKIKNNRVPAEYNSFATASLTLLIFEFIALRNIVMEMFLPTQIATEESSSGKKGTKLNLKKKNRTMVNHVLSNLQAQDSAILYGFLLFNYIIAGFMQVILSYFTTDG
tara:strand:- start:3650 stop:4273 length:624 start_codon:yes stop_codon:yes gene_type:complete